MTTADPDDRSFLIRTMNRSDLDRALDWAVAEGWNPGLHDADCFHAADPNGFFVGDLDGEPIGCISTVAYGRSFGFLGLYIVRPGFRGQGYGMKLWNAGLAYLGERNVGLDGVLAQQANYKKSGFALAYRNIRYEGVGSGTAPSSVINLATVKYEELLAYDRPLFPAPRAAFLRCWTKQAGATALGVRVQGRLGGYGIIRACRTGFKIGPLFADDAAIAESLFQALAAQAPNAPIFLDVPEDNAAAVVLAERHAMKRVFETARMCTKGVPPLPLEKVFGVTTFELG